MDSKFGNKIRILREEQKRASNIPKETDNKC